MSSSANPFAPDARVRACWIGPACPNVDGPRLALAGISVVAFRDPARLDFAAANRRGVIVIAPSGQGVVAVLQQLVPLARRGANIIALVERATDGIEAIRAGASDALLCTISEAELGWRISRWHDVYVRDLERRRALAILGDQHAALRRELERLRGEHREPQVDVRLDPDTGLLSLDAFLDSSELVLALCQRIDGPASLLVATFDGCLGGQLDFLPDAAALLDERSRHSDVVGRTGVAEISMFLPATEPLRAHSAAVRLHAALRHTPVLTPISRFGVTGARRVFGSPRRALSQFLREARQAAAESDARSPVASFSDHLRRAG